MLLSKRLPVDSCVVIERLKHTGEEKFESLGSIDLILQVDRMIKFLWFDGRNQWLASV